MRRLLWLFEVALVWQGIAALGAAPLAELEPSRLSYQAAIAEIHADRDQLLAPLNRTYLDRLSQLAAKLDASGDDGLVKAVLEEKERVSKGLDTTAEERRAMGGLLLVTRVSYEKERSMETAAVDRREGQTNAAWAAFLQQWHDYYLKAGQASNAALVLAEIDKVAALAPTVSIQPGALPAVAGNLAGKAATPVPKTDRAAPGPVVPRDPRILQVVSHIKMTNSTGAMEGKDVLVGAVSHNPDLFKSIAEVELVQARDFAAEPMKHNSGGPEKMEGAHADKAIVSSDGGIVIWGPYDKLAAGRYLIVYRVRFFEEMKGEACFLDIAHKGVTASGAHPQAAEVPLGVWHEIALPLRVERTQDYEYRLWGTQHRMAMDRVYVYRVKAAL